MFSASYFFITSHKVTVGGEQPLPQNGCCDLGPIILTKLVKNPFTDQAEFDFEKLKEIVRVQVRFLDNVLDATLWPLEEQREESSKKRRIGIGFTGLANTLAMMNKLYFEPSGLELAELIAKTMRDTAYDESINLAIEKGPFPLFSADKYLEEGTFASRLPENIKNRIREHGIRNSHLLSIAPVGCVTPDTLIISENGLHEISNLKNNEIEQWQDINVNISTDSGFKKSDKFYINGVKSVKRITDDYGFMITATDNHQLRVIDDKGNYIWKRFDELNIGDVLVKCINTYPKTMPEKIPNNETNENHGSINKIKENIKFTEGIAELIGFIMSNGNVKTERHIRLFHHVDYAEKAFSKIINTLENDLGINSTKIYISQRENNPKLAELNIYSKELVTWLKINDSLKKNGHNLNIPNWILSSDRTIIHAFIRGLYEGDGSGGLTSITYTSVDKNFIIKLQQVLASIGILSRRDISNYSDRVNRFGLNDVHRLSIGNRVDKFNFLNNIGFISNKGKALIINYEHDNIFRTFYRSVRSTLTKAFGFFNYKKSIYDHLKEIGVTEDVVFSEITSIEQLEPTMTVDISVPDNVTYIANSFVSHNTVSLAFADNASNGIEPPFSLAYTRKKRTNTGHQMYNVLDHSFRVWVNMVPDKEFAKVIEEAVCSYKTEFEYQDKKYIVKDILPSSIVTALEMSTDQHLLMMKTVQPYIDTSISKTVNVPKDYPFEDFKAIYEKAWNYKLKGISTYRPNDIIGSVLSVEQPKETEVKPVVQENKQDTDNDKSVQDIVKEMYSEQFESRKDGELSGVSIKGRFHTNQGEQKFILTINFIEIQRQSQYGIIAVKRPVEFLLTSNFTSNSSVWDTSMRFMSLMGRSGVPMNKIIENLKEVTWEHGPVRYGTFSKNGKDVPLWHNSDTAVIGYVIEQLLKKEGLLDNEGLPIYKYTTLNNTYDSLQTNSIVTNVKVESGYVFTDKPIGKKCLQCGAYAVIKKDGCEQCQSCGEIGSCG